MPSKNVQLEIQKHGPLLILFCLTGVLFLSRWHTAREPVERDIAIYSVIGHEMLAGKHLYSDLWENKPPAIYVTCMIAEWFVGYGLKSIFLINMVGCVFVLFGIYKAASILSRTAGVWAAVIWAIISGDPYLQGNQPNCELYMNGCLVWFLVLTFKAEGSNLHQWEDYIAGLLAGLATFYKYTALMPVLAIGIADLLVTLYQRRAMSRQVLRKWWTIGGVMVGLWGLLFGYLYLNQQLQPFIDYVFRFNFYYGRSGGGSLTGLSVMQRFLSGWVIMFREQHLLSLTLPLNLICGIGFFLGWYQGFQRVWILWFMFALGTFLEMTIPGHFYPHYFLLFVPVWALGIGWTLVAAHRPATLRALSWGGLVLVVFLLRRELPWYGQSPIEWSRMKYEDRFSETPRLSEELNRLLGPQESFYNWGNDAELYFQTRRRPPTGIFLQYPLVRSPDLLANNERVIRDLERVKPKLVVVSKYAIEFEQPKIPIVSWIVKNYQELPAGGDRGSFILLGRREKL